MRSLLVVVLHCVSGQINFQESGGRGVSTQTGGFQSSSGSSGRFVAEERSVTRTVSSSQGSCCKPLTLCASVLFSSGERSRSSCELPNGSFGVCCSEIQVGSVKGPYPSADVGFGIRSSTPGGFSPSQVTEAFRRGEISVNNATIFPFRTPDRGTGAFYHARFQRQARSETGRMGRSGLLLETVAQELSDLSFSPRSSVTNTDAVNFGPLTPQTRSDQGRDGTCPGRTLCSSSRYRSTDGSCNNQREGIWGKSDTVLNRILPPKYSDGIETPRRSRFGSDLPSPRLISTRLATNFNNKDLRYTAIVMSFGQFVDHDLTQAPVLKSATNQDLDCCSAGARSNIKFCLPISIPFDDRFFQGRKDCMNFVRSTPGPSLDCSVRYREQLNQVTHWLDLSQVYGSDDKEQRDIREFSGGRLTINSGPDGPLLPTNLEEKTCKAGTCMKAGDGRVNEQPNLGIIHIIFMREHNRVAGELSRLNPNWSDEQLYQEARKICIGEYQHIIYNEWLPIVLGKQFMRLFGLFPLSSGYSQDYDSSIDPRITNEFAAAGMRFGHSLIPGMIQVNNRIGREVNPSFTLRDSFFKPELLRLPGMVDGLISGLTRENIEQFDSSFTEDITNHLFDGDANGMDLISLNLQRGRDHGLAGYTQYRQLCGLGATNSFSDLSRSMPVRRTEELQQIYESPDDIDLFVGMFSENPQSDSIVGPTTLCILGDQFAR